MLRDAVGWWIAVELVGLLALPITLVLFRRLNGRGYAFAKPVGLLLGGYIFWLALEAHVLPNRPGSIFWAYVPLMVADVLILRRYWRELWAEVQDRWAFILAVEVAFTGFFFVGAHLRSFIPEINGTEKPMDFMLLNTASRSRYYPPDDAWYSGAGVSYYYFGYVIQAMIAKISATPAAIAFNLALASTAALAASTAFGLAYEVVTLLRRIPLRAALAAGAGAVLLVAVMGNLEGALEFGAANDRLPASIVRKVDIAGLDKAQVSESCLLGQTGNCLVSYPSEKSSFWWWWRSTRISPKADTITEFPFFSFLLGDLHPHVMAIPFVFTVIALGLSFWRSREPLGFRSWRGRLPYLGASAALLGGLGFLNTWDLPTFGFVLALLVFARCLRDSATARTALKDAAGFFLPLAALALVLYAPFYFSFSSQASGFDAVRDGATRPMQTFLLWAPMLCVALPLPISLLLRDRTAYRLDRLMPVGLAVLALLALWAVLLVAKHGAGGLGDAISARGWNWLTTLFIAVCLVATVLPLWRALERRSGNEDAPMLIPTLAAMSTALLLMLGVELFFVQDVFGSRINTQFKLYYQAWLLLGVSGAVGMTYLLTLPREAMTPVRSFLREAWQGVMVLFVGAALLYPLGGMLSRSEGLSKPRSLDGLVAARVQQPEDMASLQWLQDHAGSGERIIQATSGDYSAGANLAAWSGIPTVVGWVGHEEQWGRDRNAIAGRAADVDKIYNSPSLAEALPILRKYHVTYVYVGALERSKYPPPSLQKFETGLTAVFRAGQSALYRVPVEEPASAPQVVGP